MFAQLNKQEKLAYTAIASVFLFGLSYVGARRLRPSTPVEVHELSASPSATEPAPKQGVPSTLAQASIVVDVEGAVNHPGIYRLNPDARVADAVQEAGGASSSADLTRLNRAEKARDGMKIVVPSLTETTTTGVGGMDANPLADSARVRKGAKIMPAEGSIDLNQATAEDLEQIPGIGASTAQKIIDLRTQRGSFTDVEELRGIRGLNGKKLDAIKAVFRL